ncbi:MAG: hypothetical protein H7Y05_10385 [Steroidobacteraceae bacterium]|nr:hypothetical protein [Deltaproteobacteria bacterium]
MDHTKCINDTINKYADFPNIQADMRKLLKYTESQFRMFLTPIIKNQTPLDEEMDAITDRFSEDDAEAHEAFKQVVLTMAHGVTDPGRPETPQKLKHILAGLSHRPELVAAVKEAGALFAAALQKGLVDAKR